MQIKFIVMFANIFESNYANSLKSAKILYFCNLYLKEIYLYFLMKPNLSKNYYSQKFDKKSQIKSHKKFLMSISLNKNHNELRNLFRTETHSV